MGIQCCLLLLDVVVLQLRTSFSVFQVAVNHGNVSDLLSKVSFSSCLSEHRKGWLPPRLHYQDTIDWLVVKCPSVGQRVGGCLIHFHRVGEE